MYDWALTPLWRLQITAEERRFGHYLLVRRSLDEKRERAYYAVYAPRRKTSRQTLVNVAGRRWEIEIGFEAAKGECGLDQYEVRRWQGWYRHITFALLAHAVLATLRVRGKKTPDALYRVGVHRVLPPLPIQVCQFWVNVNTKAPGHSPLTVSRLRFRTSTPLQNTYHLIHSSSS
ncbi:transposase [Burkholderia ubonensis]|uniref:transposase n=1 Tax=Burkholderia ubonensis TaxID=101571 RepID=UPI001E54573F|nr:transposase [Burkholderia ubonensis]